ncbi:MAG: DUF2752 domain-containing protein [Chthoniobacterales bacterium]
MARRHGGHHCVPDLFYDQRAGRDGVYAGLARSRNGAAMKIGALRTPDSRHDPEILWLLVLGTMGVAGLVSLQLGVRMQRCLFHDLTGLPCPTCGGTRCLRNLIEGNFESALAWNPLVFLAAIACAIFMLYAITVVCFRLPRLRLKCVSRRQSWLICAGGALLLATNWIYLIWRGI